VAIEVVLPKWGMGIDEGTVLEWLKSEGDHVKEGEPLVEVETAKATQPVESPVSGRLVKILRAVGETAAVNTPLCLIDERDV
jgi:pyruvate/2-oxoglutarate dehydrogenase complex dihydrolipoamide acyltransferase (E2) component